MVDGEIIEPGITAKGCYGKEDNTQEQMDNISRHENLKK